jgi:WW domain
MTATDRKVIVVDTRSGDDFMHRWKSSYRENSRMLGNGLPTLCELEIVTAAQMRRSQLEKESNDILSEALHAAKTGSSLDKHRMGKKIGEWLGAADTSAQYIAAVYGFETKTGFLPIHDYISSMRAMGVLPRAGRYAASILHVVELNERNFYALVKIIDLRHSILIYQQNWVGAETMLIDWLSRFKAQPLKFRTQWSFTNDPVLDLLEYLLVFYRDVRLNQDWLSKYKHEYLDYCIRTYRGLIPRLCLGCGVGVFGMSFSRIRMEAVLRLSGDGIGDLEDGENLSTSTGQRTKDADEDMFVSIKRIHGGRATKAADLTKSRQQERDECHSLMQEFLRSSRANPSRILDLGHPRIPIHICTALNTEDDLLRRPRRIFLLSRLDRLPAGFEARLTEDFRIYFIDHNTKTTSWDPPQTTR